MTKTTLHFLSGLLALTIAAACADRDDLNGLQSKKQSIAFDVLVTRDGKTVTRQTTGARTKGDAGASSSDKTATMDPDLPFGIIGVNPDTRELVVDNATVFGDSDGNYSGMFDKYSWNNAERIDFSAYYPHVAELEYGEDNGSYSIDYSTRETEAGPLVSKTVQKFTSQLNMVPVTFMHITNDIGYKICDATPADELKGLIHLRKLTATNVACAGQFVNDIQSSSGVWRRQQYYRDIVIFEGDAKVGTGSENEMFVGFDTLEETMAASHRYYSIPCEIEFGKQYVEVVYDVEGFTHNGFDYPPLKDQVARYMLYGLLANNEFIYGKQYTFHLGLDLSSVYHAITFAPSVSGWETKIYENNDDF